MNNNYIIFDFDSTIIKGECLEILAELSLQVHPNKNDILAEIQKLTDLGMAGEISFTESFSKRMQLLSITTQTIKKANEIIINQITNSFIKNIKFFHDNSKNIFIISGGFKECIYPIADILKIPKDNIYANEFIYSPSNKIIGFDKNNPLSKEQGKVKVVEDLKLDKPVFVIGDGFSDFQIKEFGLAEKFFVLTENIYRKNVVNLADKEIKSLSDFIKEYSTEANSTLSLQPNIF